MTEHDIRRAAALSKIIREIPKQLEAIAAEWERRGATLGMVRSVSHQARGEQLSECAAELREYVATWKHAGEEP